MKKAIQVDFYILDTLDLLTTACRLLEKAYYQSLRSYVHTSDIALAKALDEKLWTFSDVSFVPHRRQPLEPGDNIAVEIGSTGCEQNCDLLMNLDADIPCSVEQFERIIELVPAEPVARNQQRAHYRDYQSLLGCVIKIHRL